MNNKKAHAAARAEAQIQANANGTLYYVARREVEGLDRVFAGTRFVYGAFSQSATKTQHFGAFGWEIVEMAAPIL